MEGEVVYRNHGQILIKTWNVALGVKDGGNICNGVNSMLKLSSTRYYCQTVDLSFQYHMYV